jgi:hypothetical protein
LKHFEELHSWFSKPEASASIDVAVWVGDRVVVVVPVKKRVFWSRSSTRSWMGWLIWVQVSASKPTTCKAG